MSVSPQLAYCVVQFLEKDSSLTEPVSKTSSGSMTTQSEVLLVMGHVVFMVMLRVGTCVMCVTYKKIYI